ncbi:AI-2E family transporter [Alkalitalea saponilacus]|uniref:Predicted PurR-regulated permease PerM n=1 Tax=Alkalitalea saponilacus TaxID=889453 RepID=A0A1T5A8M5_9BACT|nr:AI-2E family transporter [Alkalitalea saponilacus]ASB48801.1 AI-2E family transporter [Alkalitalea saponilacus]SKB31209.1 Predicted PurR-regulated permease PerM [Alkalitalea saponilacus]
MKDVVKYLALVAILIAGGFLVWYFRSVFFFILISAVFSLIARPLFDQFKRIHIGRKHLSNGLAALLTVLVIWILIITFFRFTIPLIGSELQYLSNVDITQVFDRVTQMLYEALQPYRESNATIVVALEDQLREAAAALLDMNRIRETVSGVVSFFGGLFVAAFAITFITFFFLKEEGLLLRLLMLVIPDEYEAGLRHVLDSVRYLLRRYFLGVLIQVFLICFLVTSGFLLLGFNFNHALTIGLVSGLLNVIPYVGPLIGAFFGIVTGIIIYLQIPLPLSLLALMGWIALIYSLVQLTDNMVFQPVIFSNSVKAHPLEIFIVIMMAGYLSGILGMFLAIPVYTIVRVVGREFFYNYKVVKKLTDGLRQNTQ